MTTKELDLVGNESAPPSFLENVHSEDIGLEFDSSDLKISRLALGAGITDEVVDGKQKSGDFFDKLTGKSYGNKVDVIILKNYKTWSKFSDDKKIIGQSIDGKYWEDGTELTHDEKFKCLSYVFTLLIADDLKSYPVNFYFRSTSISEATNLLNIIIRNFDKTKPIHSRVFTLSSTLKTHSKGKYHSPTITLKGWCNEDQFMAADSIIKSLSDRPMDGPVNDSDEISLD